MINEAQYGSMKSTEDPLIRKTNVKFKIKGYFQEICFGKGILKSYHSKGSQT